MNQWSNFTMDRTMLRLEKVDGRSVWDILKLSVSEKQKNFVADNKI